MTENELRTAMGFDLCDCNECRTQKARTTTTSLRKKEKETTMTYAPNGYEPALEALRTAEQRRALEIRAVAFAAIDQHAAATSAENAAHFRAMADQNAGRAKYPAPNPYASVLKGAN